MARCVCCHRSTGHDVGNDGPMTLDAARGQAFGASKPQMLAVNPAPSASLSRIFKTALHPEHFSHIIRLVRSGLQHCGGIMMGLKTIIYNVSIFYALRQHGFRAEGYRAAANLASNSLGCRFAIDGIPLKILDCPGHRRPGKTAHASCFALERLTGSNIRTQQSNSGPPAGSASSLSDSNHESRHPLSYSKL